LLRYATASAIFELDLSRLTPEQTFSAALKRLLKVYRSMN
jgi:hypothetical protein